MPKKSKSPEKKEQSEKIQDYKNIPQIAPGPMPLPQLSKEQEEKLKEIKTKLDKFQKQVIEKFDKYIMGVALMPPPQPKQGEQIDKDRINVLILVDDSDSKKMTKLELKD